MGLVDKVRIPEGKKYQISLTEEGQTLNQRTTTSSLELTLSSLTTQDRRHLATCLIALLRKSRGLLGISEVPSPRNSDRGDAENKTVAIATGQDLLHRDLWSLLDRTRFAISRYRELELAHFGLTIEQVSILHVLKNHGGSTTIKDLENITMRRQHSISVLINGMARAGLAEKVKNREEKRFRIVITPEGRAV